MQSKRKWIIFAVILGWVLMLALQPVISQQGVTPQKIAEGIYHLKNIRGGNIVASIGKDGVLLIDSGTDPEDVEKIKAAIAEKTDKSIRYIINTHWHSDHTAGNEKLHQAGAEIIAHENTAKRMKTDQFFEFFDRKVPASPKDAWPTKTFKDKIEMKLNGDDLLIDHMQPGHTDGDAIVYFKKANVIHTGDLYFNGYYPYIGISSGGSVNDMILVVNKIIKKIDDKTVVIPGHGPLSNKTELKNYVNMLTVIRDNMLPLVKAGKTLEEVQAAKPTAEFDDIWGKTWMEGDDFVRLLYMGMTKRDDL